MAIITDPRTDSDLISLEEVPNHFSKEIIKLPTRVIEKIYLSPPHLTGLEKQYINEALDSNWVSPYGSNIDQFEKRLSNYLGIEHIALLSSGTAAIHLALISAGVDQDDEVICPTLNFAASINPVLYQKAKPVLIDSELQTWNMNPDVLDEAIRDRIKKNKKPKAIIMVHIYGVPAQINKILSISEKYEITLIENSAEAFGSRYKNIPVCNFGESGIVSFNGNKIITTSGGGALVSKNKEIIEKAKYLSNQARKLTPNYYYEEVGYTYMMSNVLAGIGRAQIQFLEKRLQQRRRNFDFYCQNLKHFDFIEFVEDQPDSLSNRWLSTVLIKPDNSYGVTRDSIISALNHENIEARPVWKPMHKQPVFMDYPFYGNGTAEYLSDNGICLPSGSNLEESDLERIVSVIIKTIESGGIDLPLSWEGSSSSKIR